MTPTQALRMAKANKARKVMARAVREQKRWEEETTLGRIHKAATEAIRTNVPKGDFRELFLK